MFALLSPETHTHTLSLSHSHARACAHARAHTHTHTRMHLHAHSHTRAHAHNRPIVLVRFVQPVEATRILLETDAKEENFHTDALRACVISAITSPETCRNTIKLVAMNLIVSDKLDSGVEVRGTPHDR